MKLSRQIVKAVPYWLILLTAAAPCFAQEAVDERIDSLQKQIDQLKAELRSQRDPQTGDSSSANEKQSESSTTIGGYGEFTYNNYRDKDSEDQADLRRFVLFFGHTFNERLQLYSELEVEHAKVEDSNDGEVALEQAYLQYSLSDATKIRAGLFLMPAGFLNEYHEPPTYFGVERNEVETRIIPSTWRELGISIQGHLSSGLEYNIGVVTSLDASKFSDASNGVRDMRSEGSEAAAHDLGIFIGLNYRAIPGITIGGSIFTGDTSQGGRGANPSSYLSGVGARLTLWDLHARYCIGGFDLKALYARGTLSDTAQINAAAGIAPDSGNAAPSSFFGGYLEAGYLLWRSGDIELLPFVRYERYNTQAAVADGYATDPNNNERVTTAGFSLRLHPQVVVKADIQNYKTDNQKDRINLGLGYMF